jgi:hypothetical protein
VAIILTDSKNLPPRTKPMPPGAKPPVTELPFHDLESEASDVDRFNELVREMRGHPQGGDEAPVD